jgi:hypothetical protein
VEVCPKTELMAIEDPATVCDGSLEISKGREVPIGEGLIQDGPEVLGGLKLGGVDAMGAARGLAQSSLDRTDGVPHAKAERLEPIPHCL